MKLIRKFQVPFAPLTMYPNYVEIWPQVPESQEAAEQEAEERAERAKKEHRHETIWDNWMNFDNIRRENAERVTNEDIPVTKDNYIVINNPKSKKTHLRVIPKAQLDSLAFHHGQNPNVDMEVVYGIPERESGYNGYSVMNLKDTDHFEVDPYFLMSTWSYDVSPEQIMYGKALERSNDRYDLNNVDTSNYFNDRKKYQQDVTYDPNIDIYSWAWEWFKKGRYNPGDSDYENKVRKDGRDIINSPAFKKWWEEEGKYYYQKGKSVRKHFWGNKILTRDAGCLDCAKYANARVEDGEGDYSTWGNAWNIKNADLVYSGYDRSTRPKKFNYDEVDKYNRAASDRVWTDFDSKTLDPNKPYLVNMYYKGSPFLETAYNEGNGVTGTHVGVLENINGTWYVTHNIHGKVFQEPFLQLQGGKKNWGVTAIFAPRTKSLINRIKAKFNF